MIKNIAKIVFIAFLSVLSSSTQAGLPGPGSVLHKHFDQIELLITLSNPLISVGSKAAIEVQLLNLSTNNVYFGDSGYNNRDFKVFLKSSSGKKVKLSPQFKPGEEISSRMITRILKPGEKWNGSILVLIDKNIDPGKYILSVTRNVIVSQKSFDIESNQLSVRILK